MVSPGPDPPVEGDVASWCYRSPYWPPILVFCVLVGLCGSQRRMGFTGTFLLSLVITSGDRTDRAADHRTVPPRETARRAELERQTEALRRSTEQLSVSAAVQHRSAPCWNKRTA